MTLANYLRMEAAVALLDGVDENLAEKVRDRMDVVWHGLSPHDITWLNSRSQPQASAKLSDIPTTQCDHGEYGSCKNLSSFRCDCFRCNCDEAFHACVEHRNSDLIEKKHQRIYPKYQLNFVRIST